MSHKKKKFEPIPRERALVPHQANTPAPVDKPEEPVDKPEEPVNKPKEPATKTKREKRRRIWIPLTAVFFIIAIAGGIFILDIPNWQTLNDTKLIKLSQTSRVYDREGALVSTLRGLENRTLVKLAQVPIEVQNAFIAAEDLRFYEHHGFDLVRIFGSVAANLQSGTYSQGASTISQQLVKLTHLTETKTLARKGEELYLAIQLESRYTKSEILEMYLNTVYFGEGAYGIQAASEYYFGKDVSELTAVEGAALAATIKAPSAYGPTASAETNKTRRDYVLRTMVDNGFISEAEGDAAMNTELTIVARRPAQNVHGWYVDAALAEAQDILGITADELLAGGYYIETAMDTGLQTIAEDLFSNASNFPANASDGTLVQGAMAVTDVHTGGLVALVGGREYTVMRGFNRATQMRRSPGSAIKPLAVYAPAIEMGYTTASILLDEQTTFSGGYTPRNSGNKYYGPVTMRRALGLSLNVATVRLMQDIGISTSTSFLKKAGIPITASDGNLSLALGAMTEGVTPVELSASYALFGNGGVYNEPYTVERIYSSGGNLIYERKAQPRTVLSAQNNYLMTSLMKTVTSTGTGSRLSAAGIEVAGKTGTNSLVGISGNRDIWMAAYTSDYSVACWMGFDTTDAAHRLSSSTSGGGATASMAASFFRSAYTNKAKPSFKVPDGLVWLTIDTAASASSGTPMLASSYTPDAYKHSEVFLESNRPWKTSSMWQAPRAVSYFYIDYESTGQPKLVFGATDNANYRIERVQNGASVVLTEVYGTAGATLTYTDWQAVAGEWYTYRVTPVHTGMLDTGVLLEGPSSTQSVQARWASTGFLTEAVKRLADEL